MSTAEEWQALVPTDPLMALAWRDAVLWAIEDKDMRKAFREATGRPEYRPPSSVIERLVDQSTGYTGPDESYYLAFVRWFNDNVWGDLNLKAGAG